MQSLVVVILLLIPASSYAAPVLAFLASPALFAGTAYAISWGAVIFTAASVLYGQATQRKQAAAAKKAAKKARDEFNASLRDRTQTGIATERPWTFIYGKARVGSNVVAMFSTGARDEYKHLVAVLAQHECEAIDEIYINGTALGPLDSNGGVTTGNFRKAKTSSAYEVVTTTTFVLAHAPNAGTVRVYKSIPADGDSFGPASKAVPLAFTIVGQTVTLSQPIPAGTVAASYQYTTYTSMIRVTKHLGSAADTADANLMAELGSKWPETAVLRGHCYLVVRLDLNQAEFQSGLPQLEALVRGKKLYDPRSGLTAYSDNNALVAYDYLTSEMGGVSASSIPVSSFISAANDCDDIVSTGAWSGKRYTFNGTITSDQNRDNVLEKIAQSMAGGIVATTWDIYAGKYSAPVMALHQSDIVGNVAISPGSALNEVYNTVKGQFISAANLYVATDFKPYINEAYLASDDEELTTDIDLPYTDTQQRCTNLCRIFTEDNRNSFSISGKFSLKAFGLKVGQRVTFTSEFFGQSAKVFRVTDKSFAPDKAVQLGLKEDAASIYDLADETVVDATPNTDLPNPFIINPIASLTCQSGTNVLLIQADGSIVSRILVTWPIATTQGVLQNGLIEIEWQVLGSDEWDRTTAKGDDTSAYLSPVHDGQLYNVRARCVNPYVNTKSDWVYAALHQVIGKTEPPPNVVDLSISGTVLNCTPVVALDLAGYVLRFHYGANLDWGSAVPLHSGLVAAFPFDLVTRPAGVVTIMCKAQDTSGNQSLASANIATDLGDAPVANVVETIDFGAAGYPGVLQGCTLISGDLVADATDSAYGTDNQSFYGSDNDPAYEASTYGHMIYTTDDVSIGSALSGSVMTLAIETQGTDLFIEYRMSGPGSFYGADSDSAYGTDSDPFYGPPGTWIPWPGQVVASNDVYQFRATIGAGSVQGKISEMSLIIDAPDIVEYLQDVVISASGTAIPYTKNFTSIKTVTATLQANASSAETIEIEKLINLTPVAKAYNASHVAVSGATADFIVKGF